MPFNPATFTSIKATAAFRGVDFFAVDEITIAPMQALDTFRLSTGTTRNIVSETGWKVTVPLVMPVTSLIPLLKSFQRLPYGRSLAPHLFEVESINTGTDVLTIPEHPFTTADEVYVKWDESGPTSTPQVDMETAYYVRNLSASTVSLHTSGAGASANTGVVNITAAGNGTLYLSRQFPLVVHRDSGVKQTFYSAAITELPQLVLAGGKRFWSGNIVFTCFPNIGSVPSDGDAAFFAETNTAYTAPTWDQDADLTAEDVSISWGTTSPWDDFRCEDGITINFNLTAAMMNDGTWPATGARMTDFRPEATGKPWGILPPQYNSAVVTDLGEQLQGEDMVISCTGFAIRLTGAAISGQGQLRFGANNAVVDTLTWTAQGDGGEVKPPFLVSTAPPPVNSVAPVISGTAETGETLSCTTGTWSNTPTSYSYDWQYDQGGGSYVTVGAADASTLVLLEAWESSSIRCVVTATNGLGATITSAPSNELGPVSP
jgi:hypothetical protein